MRNLPAVTLVLAILLVLDGCDLLVDPNIDGNLPDKTFWAYNFITGGYYQVAAANLTAGQHCIIYKDKNAVVDVDAAKALAREFDSKMFSLVVDNFGEPLDVDGNGKIILLLLDILDGGSKNNGYTAGYFWSGNMYRKSSDSKEMAYYSNEADMLYIDTNPGVVNDEACRSTVVHEMQHLVNFSAWAATDGSKQYTDTWIDEGLSTAAEDLYLGKRLSDRIGWFKEDRYQTIRYGNNFFVWDGYWEKRGDELSNYATVYLFFQWLRIHARNGAGIYRDIINHQYGDYRAVTQAAANQFSPAINNDWETLLRTWYAANLLESETGLTGYKNQIALAVHYYLISGTSRNLYPGEGVYSLLASDREYLNTGNIIYAGLKKGEAVDTDGSYTKNWYLLTLNVNTNLKGGSEIGAICNIVSSTGGNEPDSAVFDASPAARSMSGDAASAFAGGRLPTLYDWDSGAAARKRFKDWDAPPPDPLGRPAGGGR